MIRETVARQLDHDPNFRWRGEAVTRIENLSDIVFALALGMIVSASTPPETLPALKQHLLTIIPVSMGFAMLVSIWSAHFTFFRRYGVADTTIIVLNAILLLLILFAAYPLRFIFDSLIAWVLGMAGDWSMMDAMGVSTYDQAGEIMAVFCAAYSAMYVLISLMYQRAYSKADWLALNAKERAITRRSIWMTRFQVLIGALVCYLSGFTIVGPFAGFGFWLLWLIAFLVDRRVRVPAAEDDLFEE